MCAVFYISGCAALSTHEAKLDQSQLRDTLMDYVDAQIMDNLIRARNGLPILHYDFSHVGATVTDKLPVTVSGGQTLTDNPEAFGAGGIVLAAARSAMRPFAVSSSPERDNAIDVEVLPIVNEKQIYAAYVAFLEAEPDYDGIPVDKGTDDSRVKTTTDTVTSVINSAPVVTALATGTSGKSSATVSVPAHTRTVVTQSTQSGTEDFNIDFSDLDRKTEAGICPVMESPVPPGDDTQVLFGQRVFKGGRWVYGAKQWRDGNYYWVPTKFRSAFFKLCLATVARGYANPIATPGSPSPTTGPGAPASSTKPIQQQLEDLNSTLKGFNQ